MAEFEGIEEKIVGIGEPIAFENKTDSDFDVSTGIVFRRSGIYEISIVGRRTIVSKVTEPKTGKWINGHWNGDSNFRIDGRGNCWYVRECSNCHEEIEGKPTKYCPNCGCRMLMEGDAQNESKILD